MSCFVKTIAPGAGAPKKKSGRSRLDAMVIPAGFSMKNLYKQQKQAKSQSTDQSNTRPPSESSESTLLVDFPGSDNDEERERTESMSIVPSHTSSQPTTVPLSNTTASLPPQTNESLNPNLIVEPEQDANMENSMPNTNNESCRGSNSHITMPKTTNESRPGGDFHIAELLRKQMEQRTAKEQADYTSDDDDNFNVSDVTYGGRDTPMRTGMGGGPAPDRALVGGFAAAAYEASRAHYLMSQGPRRTTKRAEGYMPPSI